MNPDYQAATLLYRSGRFAELLNSSPTTPASVSMLPDIEHRLLIAETLIYADETDSGAAILASVEPAGEKAVVRAKYEFVSGLLTKRRGRFQLSMRHLQSAVRA